jgi:hypothetical protein
MTSVQRKSPRRRGPNLLAIIIGASVIVALGGLAAAFHEEKVSASNAEQSIGTTSTETTPPSTLEISFAAPTVKAKAYK